MATRIEAADSGDRGWLSANRGVRTCGLVVVLTLAAQVCDGPCNGQTDAGGGKGPRGTKEWTSLGLGGGGAMFTPAISPADPRLILLNCDMSGGYRSTDGGKNWEMIHYRQLRARRACSPVWHPDAIPTSPSPRAAGAGR